MSMSGDEDTEASTSEDSTSTTDSESDDKHRKSRKKKGARHRKQSSKSKKEKHTSRKKAENDETSSESSSSKSKSGEDHRAKKRRDTRTGWKETLKDRDEAITDKGKAHESRETDEVEELVDRLARMKVSDSDYARIYYRALKRDAAIANIVAPPAK